MANLENAIKGLECCVSRPLSKETCDGCPYRKEYNTGLCWLSMNNDALEMLKGQEKIINRLQKDVADLRDALSMTD